MFLKFICLVVVLVNWKTNTKASGELVTNVREGLEKLLKFWYPEDAEFNESCVSEDCPALNKFSLCPKDMNITVLHRVLETAIGCMRKPICGLLIDNIRTTSVTTTVEELLPGYNINGTVSTLDGTGYLHNVSNMQFEIMHDQTHHQLPIQVTMSISNLQSVGYLKFELSLRKAMPSNLIATKALSVSIPQIKYQINAEYISTMLINQSLTHDHNYDIKMLNPSIKVHPVFCGLDVPEGFPNIVTLLTTMTQTIIENSYWAVRKAAFLQKYLQSAFHVASNNC